MRRDIRNASNPFPSFRLDIEEGSQQDFKWLVASCSCVTGFSPDCLANRYPRRFNAAFNAVLLRGTKARQTVLEFSCRMSTNR
jgi:hypothetical protein